MSTRLPQVSGRKVATALVRTGFTLLKKRGKGSHLFLFRGDPPTAITVPNHRVVRRGTLRAIIRQAGLTVDEFNQLLK